jgi:hypothetical protein
LVSEFHALPPFSDTDWRPVLDVREKEIWPSLAPGRTRHQRRDLRQEQRSTARERNLADLVARDEPEPLSVRREERPRRLLGAVDRLGVVVSEAAAEQARARRSRTAEKTIVRPSGEIASGGFSAHSFGARAAAGSPRGAPSRRVRAARCGSAEAEKSAIESRSGERARRAPRRPARTPDGRAGAAATTERGGPSRFASSSSMRASAIDCSAAVGVLAQAAREHVARTRAASSAGSADQSGSARRIADEHVGHRLAARTPASGEALVEDAAEREDVAPLVDRLAARLLGLM